MLEGAKRGIGSRLYNDFNLLTRDDDRFFPLPSSILHLYHSHFHNFIFRQIT